MRDIGYFDWEGFHVAMLDVGATENYANKPTEEGGDLLGLVGLSVHNCMSGDCLLSIL